MKSKSKAPDRIWVWWDNGYDVGMVNTHGDKRYTPSVAREYAPADRIEKLEKELEYWRGDSAAGWDKCEEYRKKLAKAVEALQQLVLEYDEVALAYDEPEYMTAAYFVACNTLAELKGKTLAYRGSKGKPLQGTLVMKGETND